MRSVKCAAGQQESEQSVFFHALAYRRQAQAPLVSPTPRIYGESGLAHALTMPYWNDDSLSSNAGINYGGDGEVYLLCIHSCISFHNTTPQPSRESLHTMQRQRREEERISSAAMNAAVSQAEALGMTPVSVVRGAGMRLGGRHQATEKHK